jgi:hypothetical protein
VERGEEVCRWTRLGKAERGSSENGWWRVGEDSLESRSQLACILLYPSSTQISEYPPRLPRRSLSEGMARRLPVFVLFPILLVLILSGLWSCVDTASWSLGPSVLRDVFSTAFPPQQLGARIEDMTRAEFVNASAPL